MALNFPDSPTDGQIFTDTSTGEQWQYTASGNYWTSLGLSKTGGLIYKGGVDITAAPPTGVKSGFVYSVTTGGAPNAGYTGLPNPTVAGSQIIYDGAKWQLSSYASTIPDASATVKGIIELATAAEVTAGTDTVRAVTPAGVKVELDKKAALASPTFTGTPKAPTAAAATNNTQLATTAFVHTATPNSSITVKGLVELATDAETTAGTDATRAVTPKSLKVELDKKANVKYTEQTITAGAFNMALGPYWTCGAIAIPNPTNAQVNSTGLIRLTAAPSGWGTNFKHAGGSATAPKAFPAIVPFYVQSASVILVGKPVEGMA